MNRLQSSWLPAALTLAVLLPAARPAAADDHDATVEKRIYVKATVDDDCEGGDCDEVRRHHKVIVLGDEGELHEIEGHAMHWVSPHGTHALAMARHGKGGFLGVSTTELTPELRSHFGVPEEAGVLVARVVEDSAAALAGVQVGDILTAVGGDSVESTGDLLHAVSRLEPGAAVDLELWRDGSLQVLGATLGERPQRRHHALMTHCRDGEECPQIAALDDLACGGDANCEVKVECRSEGCECTVNGEPTECETLPGFAAPGE